MESTVIIIRQTAVQIDPTRALSSWRAHRRWFWWSHGSRRLSIGSYHSFIPHSPRLIGSGVAPNPVLQASFSSSTRMMQE